MIRRYTLPAVTIEGQDTSIGVSTNDKNLREWLSRVKRSESVNDFTFLFAEDPNETECNCLGMFRPRYAPFGIYVWVDLLSARYRGVSYPIDKFYHMVKCAERPSFGLRVTVKV